VHLEEKMNKLAIIAFLAVGAGFVSAQTPPKEDQFTDWGPCPPYGNTATKWEKWSYNQGGDNAILSYFVTAGRIPTSLPMYAFVSRSKMDAACFGDSGGGPGGGGPGIPTFPVKEPQ
jgi:hypothetical protein